MRFHLRSIDDSAPPIELHDGEMSVGRAPDNDVVLQDVEVSKHHADIVTRDGQFWLRDARSANGTLVNNEPISEHQLSLGDVIVLGQTTLVFELAPANETTRVIFMPAAGESPPSFLATAQLAALLPAADLPTARLAPLYDRVRTAFSAVQELIELTDMPTLGRRILDVTFELVQADCGVVLLYDAAEELQPLATRANAQDAELLLSSTVLDHVVRTRTAVLASDALTDARFSSAESVVLAGFRSFMCVPLVRGERVHGILHVSNSNRIGAFSQADLELVAGIATGAGVAIANALLVNQLAEEARTRESLGRFLSPVLVEQVLQRRLQLTPGGEERDVTVMFADIRDFTGLTERRAPSDVVALLNSYFEHMVEVVFEHGGILDKFIGDAVMAVWGTPVSRDDDAARALQGAVAMQRLVSEINHRRVANNEEPVYIGIGLASGRCLAGNIGARRRMEYTVIGNAVNLASRLSGHAKAGTILMDALTCRLAGSPEEAVRQPALDVKGFSEPVLIYCVQPTDGTVPTDPRAAAPQS